MNLAAKKCVPCEGGTPPMPREMVDEYLKELPGWIFADNKIEKSKDVSDNPRDKGFG